jgi:crotonobetainyl-CoA:carnitine CoA-transferase CaiB-like acyl-CoA transferase
MEDPHLAARNVFPTTTDPARGEQRAVAPPWRFTETPTDPLRWTPELGQDNQEVFCGLLGMDEAELTALQDAQVIW